MGSSGLIAANWHSTTEQGAVATWPIRLTQLVSPVLLGRDQDQVIKNGS